MVNYTNRIFSLGAIVVASMLAAACATGGGGTLGAMTEDGLQRINLNGIGFMAMKPGTNLAAYDKVYIEPVSVEIARGWQPKQTGTRLTTSAEEMDRLKRDIADRFMSDFSSEFAENARLEIVDSPQAGALKITPRLVDVKVTSLNPENRPGESFTRNAGRARLELAVHDSVTNELLARLEDSRETPPSSSGAESSTSTYAELGRIFSGWGNFVSDGLLTFALEVDQS